ncbi:MAG: galactokinase, partial [Burkholderiales bacterium]
MTTYLEVQKKATASFAACFQSTPTIWARAPGRVNLIGEHTDYNDGFVLPCAINFGTLVGISARHDRLVCVVAADQLDARDEFSLDAPITQSQENPWSNYVRGVVRELQSAGYALNGANLSVSG